MSKKVYRLSIAMEAGGGASLAKLRETEPQQLRSGNHNPFMTLYFFVK